MEAHDVLVITHDKKIEKEFERRIEKRPGPDPEIAIKALTYMIAESYRKEINSQNLKKGED